MEPEDCQSTSDASASASAADTPSESPIPDERRPDTERQSLAPRGLYPDTARGSASHVGCGESHRMPNGITLYTIWARLLTERNGEGRGISAVSAVNDEVASGSGFPASHGRAADLGEAATKGEAGLPPEPSGTCALVSPQLTSQVLQIPRSGCCCVCHVSWTDGQQQRALAVEKLIETAFNRSDEGGDELTGQSSRNSHSAALRGGESSHQPYSEANEAAGERLVYLTLPVRVF